MGSRMHELIAKYRVQRSSLEVRRANADLERTIRKLVRKLTRSTKGWRPAEEDKTDWLARATIYRALGYVSSALRLFTDRRSPAISQGLDLTRTGLEHAYVLVVLAQERDAGREFVVDWAQRMQAKGLKRLVEAPYGDEADKEVVGVKLNEMLQTVGEKFARPTVEELVARANLRAVHGFAYAQLSPYSHFDLPKTLEMAYELVGGVPKDVQISCEESRCEALHNLLSVCVYLAIARRDFGDGSIVAEVEICAEVLRETQAIAPFRCPMIWSKSS